MDVFPSSIAAFRVAVLWCVLLLLLLLFSCSVASAHIKQCKVGMCFFRFESKRLLHTQQATHWTRSHTHSPYTHARTAHTQTHTLTCNAQTGT